MALIVVLSAFLASILSAAAADHELKLIPTNTHTGSFDARIKPVLQIAPGDTVTVETSVPFGMDRLLTAGASEAEIPDRPAYHNQDVPVLGHDRCGAASGESRHSQWRAGVYAGNLDFKELVPGSSLYIPVHVPGALLSIGDGHAVRGDVDLRHLASSICRSCLAA
jgi:acetamidase/formamidase